jgi:hypothetical protein
MSGGYCSPCRTEPEATAGVEGEAEERARVDDDPGGAPATLELALGRLGVVNLQHDKLGERRTKRERKGAEGCCLSPAATMAWWRWKSRGGGAACKRCSGHVSRCVAGAKGKSGSSISA